MRVSVCDFWMESGLQTQQFLCTTDLKVEG